MALIKKFNGLPPQESVLRSLSILIDIVKFDVEVFHASIGVSFGVARGAPQFTHRIGCLTVVVAKFWRATADTACELWRSQKTAYHSRKATVKRLTPIFRQDGQLPLIFSLVQRLESPIV